ncbi:MAG TPA: Yae1 family protein [Verrucomicrobiota bacterium]|nr:Yae1 family protein [Verrucomicrobiota bacterium]
MESPPSDYDGAWKETLEQYWHPFLALCFPAVAAGIDWSQPCRFLDKELQDVVRDSESGRRFVDKLVQVYRNDGSEQWVLVHVEVQSDPDAQLPGRMFQYHHRVSDRYQHPVASLAVLADDQPGWQPGPYEAELWGCRVRFEYPVCKLLDLDDGLLERSDNQVAWVIAAQRAAQRTVKEPHNRKRLKMQLVRRLYERGFERNDILALFRLIDWQITLPAPLEIDFQREVEELEKEKVMPYVTSIERLGIQKGRQEGLQEGRQEGIQKGLLVGRVEAAREDIQEALLARFGPLPAELIQAIEAVSERAQLRRWLRLAVTVPSLEAFQGAMSEVADQR